MPTRSIDHLREPLKRAAAALRDAGIPFLLGGGLAIWARGGPGSGHDVDFLVRPEDAEAALQVLKGAGMRTERPPEGWLFKAYDDDVMIDVIFAPSGLEMNDEVIARGDDIEVAATGMRVMAIEDVLTTKLAALREHLLDYESVVEIGRSLREQIDWAALRERAPDTPYVRAYFTLVEALGIMPPVTAGP